MTGSQRRASVAALGLVLAALAAPGSAGAAPPAPEYRAGDFADGQALSVLPPGENGLVNGVQALQFQTSGARPPNSQDQLGPYADLLYAPSKLTDGDLGRYYADESFGVRPADVKRVEQPAGDVTIYRDGRDVPHIYGATSEAAAFGAGYVAAEDRLFLIDVLRHYGSGTLSAFIGPSCADEKMDHDQLLLAPYTEADRQAQIDSLPRLGPLGARVKSMGESYVAGINAYIAKTATDPSLLPVEYPAATGGPPQPWKVGDLISIASLVGGIFGKGGGSEVRNAALLQYLDRQLGRREGPRMFKSLKEQNDPDAPTTTRKRFPYEIPGRIRRSTAAMPDDAAAPLTGTPTNTTPNCELTSPNPAAMKVAAAMLRLPKAMSNALVVDARHSATGHPLAVFGPQVGYFAPQILMQEELHAPDLAAEGASFPGTNLVVQLGRGPDFAWSATSAGSDNVDQRLELVCDPGGGKPAPQGAFYLFRGKCLPMTHNTFSETATTKAGGTGAPVTIDHEIYTTRHGVVQGWTTSRGRPVAVVTQRSTFGREFDSAVGFLRWNTPSLTTSARSWFKGAEQIFYTFNWFYADHRDIGYYVSGRDPVRPSNVDPNLPTWGTGNTEWRGFLSSARHPHEINPKQGFFTSWNNKPAPGFSAADATYSYGPVYRSLSLDEALRRQFAVHHGKINRADLVSAMETAATVDLSGRRVLPGLFAYLRGRRQPQGVGTMLVQLRAWLATGAHRKKAKAGDSQYASASAVAIMDELYPRLIRAIFDPILGAGGVYSYDGLPYGYNKLPLDFANTPNAQGQHLGSAYDDAGWEGHLVTFFRQLRHRRAGLPFSPGVLRRVCDRRGPAGCRASIARALAETYAAMVAANGGSTTVSGWTQSTASKTAKQTMPQYDAIQLSAIGLVDQPALDWQNRPTFQQAVSFPRHR